MADPRARGGGRPGGRPPRRATVDPARLAAYDVLRAVRVEDAYANLVLPRVLRQHGLTGRDAAFTTELVSGAVRRQGTYDLVVDACLAKPRLEAKVRDVLRLGVHQLFAMRVPTHAAISTSVDLTRARVGVGPAGLVNAVLRRVAETDHAGWVRRLAPDPGTDPDGFSAVAHAHPRWVVAALREALAAGGRGDELEALLDADNAPPRVVLVARPGHAGVDELLAAGGERGRWSPHAVELAGGEPSAVSAVAEGRAGVQDEGSQLVALALAAADTAGGDERWLDLCAGPGGKAALLAALAPAAGARLLASERQPHRAALVAHGTRAVRDGLVGVVAADGTAPAWRPGAFDRVLVDAPCSGLGALRRRPESRWRRTADDLDALVPLQRTLLGSALDATRPGGVVLYATCSPVLAETAGVVSDVLAARDDVRLEDAAPLLPQLADAAGPLAGTLQLWPHRHGTDAMFLALLRRG
ncbi:transcription antitermination factor NusB [Nocardioides perillae]|uniref:16S rRNA (Cytosine967-C5)-methyltransferase n=1 Tax=Nocardioides perillae TaxID=1119534 RepID=A0A7Y9RWX6_9ACTN|nr:16S rRNA (cytosine967-C5)-methyltransferase [Nocardioides perillae]